MSPQNHRPPASLLTVFAGRRAAAIGLGVAVTALAACGSKEKLVTIEAEVPGAWKQSKAAITLEAGSTKPVAPVSVASFQERAPEVTVVMVVQGSERFLSDTPGADPSAPGVRRNVADALGKLVAAIPTDKLQVALLTYDDAVQVAAPLGPSRGAPALPQAAAGKTRFDLVR